MLHRLEALEFAVSRPRLITEGAHGGTKRAKYDKGHAEPSHLA